MSIKITRKSMQKLMLLFLVGFTLHIVGSNATGTPDPIAARIASAIWKHQHPEDCDGAKALVVQMVQREGEGLASVIHTVASALAEVKNISHDLSCADANEHDIHLGEGLSHEAYCRPRSVPDGFHTEV